MRQSSSAVDGPADEPLRPEDLAPEGPVVREPWLGAPVLSYPRRPRTVVDVLDRAARSWPHNPATVDPDGTTLTYAQLAERVEAATQSLRSLGVRPGHGVGVLSASSSSFLATILACARAGAVMVGLNPREAPASWSWTLRHGGSVLALHDAGHVGLVQAAADAGLDAARVLPLEQVVSAPAPWSYDASSEMLDEAATYALVHTSGTTGRPKGSQVVHRCSVHSGMSYQRVLQLRPGERTAVLFPLHYISAMHAHVIPAMLAGATCVFLDGATPRSYLRALREQRIAWAYTVPSMWNLVLRERDLAPGSLPDLRVAGTGGAPLTADLRAAFRERLPGVALVDIYGLSETHSPATMLLDHEQEAHPGSVGRPLPCMEVAVRDDEGCDLPSGEVGEIWLRGSLVTTGYHADPAATAAAIVDGWFDTGDVGRLDAAGFLQVLDRSKDMINRGGTKVFSAQVEQLLRTHPDVVDAAVVAAPDRLHGEAVAAFVVREPGAGVEGRDLRRWVTERLAEHAAPTVVRFVEELPRGTTGKTDKKALRAQLAG
ncbi:MAG: class I adenylate-forming enzyme family protein [Motilibacteraceae bacterium]